MFLKRLIRRIIGKLGILIYRMEAEIARATLPQFANTPQHLRIDVPRKILNPEYMFLGDNNLFGTRILSHGCYPLPYPFNEAPG